MGQILNGSNEIKQIFLGSTEIKEVWVGGTKIYPPSGVAGSGIITPLYYGANTSLANVGTDQATAEVTFFTDGTLQAITNLFYDPENDGNDNGVTGGNYYSPTTGGIGASYWLLVNAPSVGTFTSGVTGSRQQLNTARVYSAVTTGTALVRVKYVKATFEIWTASTGGTKVCDGELTLRAEVDNS